MEIQEDKRGDITVLSLAGRLDTNTSGSLEQKLVDALDAGVTKFIIDFTQLNYMRISLFVQYGRICEFLTHSSNYFRALIERTLNLP